MNQNHHHHRPQSLRGDQSLRGLKDSRLSWKAKGLLVWLLSYGDNFQMSEAQIIAASTDGVRAVRSAVAELQAAGYLQKTNERVNGRYSWSHFCLSKPSPSPSKFSIRPAISNKNAVTFILQTSKP
jgi:hypothetical protein